MLDSFLKLLVVLSVMVIVAEGVHQYFDWWKNKVLCGLFGCLLALLMELSEPMPPAALLGASVAIALCLMKLGQTTNPHYKARQIKFMSEFESIDFEEVAE